MNVTARRPVIAPWGIDAPGVIRVNLAIAALMLIVQLVEGALVIGPLRIVLWLPILFCAAPGFAMLAYSIWGKPRHCVRLLALHDWRGDETVLDVGTGRGVLLAGAARRAVRGHAIGIDLWQARDLSGNDAGQARAAMEREGVAGRTSICSGDARALPLPDASIDVVVSNLCLHNIPQRDGRAMACREIARVLRPGGVALLSDMMHLGDYAATLRNEGLSVQRRGPWPLTTFPPLGIVMARKSDAGASAAGS